MSAHTDEVCVCVCVCVCVWVYVLRLAVDVGTVQRRPESFVTLALH